MAKKYRMGSSKKEQAEERKNDLDAFVKKAVKKQPGNNNETTRIIEDEKTSSPEDEKTSSPEDEKTSSPTMQEPVNHEPEKEISVGLTLFESTAKTLRKMIHSFQDEHGTFAPSRNQIITVAIERLVQDLQGDDREEIVHKLLKMKREAKERQSKRRSRK